MEEQLKEFEKEIEIIKRMVNGYLASNPVLANLELDTLGLMPKKKAKAKSKRNIEFAAEDNTILPSGHEAGFESRKCRECLDEKGHPYCYYGPNGCPVF
jgi:hypothetical protein